MKVKNLNGTSDNKCKCSSLIKHYEIFSGKKVKKCCCCGKDAILGGHVQLVDSKNQHWFIIPLCYDCNKIKDEIFEINLSVNDLVSANVNLTCGK